MNNNGNILQEKMALRGKLITGKRPRLMAPQKIIVSRCMVMMIMSINHMLQRKLVFLQKPLNFFHCSPVYGNGLLFAINQIGQIIAGIAELRNVKHRGILPFSRDLSPFQINGVFAVFTLLTVCWQGGFHSIQKPSPPAFGSAWGIEHYFPYHSLPDNAIRFPGFLSGKKKVSQKKLVISTNFRYKPQELQGFVLPGCKSHP
jgi:hypothetical protein